MITTSLEASVRHAAESLALHAAYLRKVATRFKASDSQDVRVLAAKLEGLARDLEMHLANELQPPQDDRIERPTARELQQLLGASATTTDADLAEIPADPFLAEATE
jgi:hypothetical protein